MSITSRMSVDLETLLKGIRQCRICKDAPIGAPLPHEPRPVVVLSNTARIAIVGQAPGTRVHQSGRPFTDPSGDRLREWMGIDDEVFYDSSRVAIIPMGFCFPGLNAKGGDLPPRPECALHWREQVMATASQVDLLLVIGQYAQKWHLGPSRSSSLTETVKRWREFSADHMGRLILPMPHPSWRNNGWIRKNPWFETELLPVLRKEVASRI